jgi:hypothetical protein
VNDGLASPVATWEEPRKTLYVTLQLAGGVTALQASAIWLVEVAAAVRPEGVDGALLHVGLEMGATVMPQTLGFSTPLVPLVNWIATWPLASAVVLTVLATALLAPLAAVKMSKAASALAPLIETSKRRCPAAVR